MTATDLFSLRTTLLEWFATHKRPLPWRHGYRPYEVWIAEIMGQQTQVERVAEYFTRWMERFPDVAALARASEQDVLKAWEGLGYYSRARNLHRAAAQLMARHAGTLPPDEKMLRDLPGIGPYTAAAILSIGFDRPCPLVDANVERIAARLRDLEEPVKSAPGKKAVADWALRFLDEKRPRLCNEALMEFGELVCTPKNPRCAECPLVSFCLAHRSQSIALRPVLKPRPARIDVTLACGIIRHEGRLYIQQRCANDRGGGLWEFPGGGVEAKETPEQATLREILEETGWSVRITGFFRTVTHCYTRYRVTLHCFWCELEPGQSSQPRLNAADQYAWVKKAELARYPYPSGPRQLVEALLGGK